MRKRNLSSAGLGRSVARRRLKDFGLASTVLAAALGLGPSRASAQDYLPQTPFPEKPPEAPKLPQVTKAPQLVKAAQPEYPPAALAEKLSGDVTMNVDLDAGGVVTAVEVTKGAGHGFDEAAIAAVKASTFSGAEIDGKPSPIRFAYTLHFVPQTTPAVVETPPEPPAPEPPPPPPPMPVVAKGVLREKGTRNPLPDADVSVIVRKPGEPESQATLGATTDQDGRFEIHGAPGVALRIVVGDTAHQPCIRDLDAAKVSADAPAEIDCVVGRRPGASYETRVRAPRETQSVTRYTLTQAELTTVPGTFGDPLRVVQNLPGVARTPFGLGLLVIRGASPQDSGVFLEGHQIPILYHFLGGPSVLTPRLIDKIDFFPGNFGVKYGRATAGIIDVGVKTDPFSRLHGQVDINLLDSSAYVEGPLVGQWSGSVSARRSYIDLLLPAFVSSTTTVAPVYWDYQAGVHRKVGPGVLSFFALGSNDTLKVISKDASRGDIDLGTSTGFHRIIGVYETNVNGWQNHLSPAFGYDRLRFSAGAIDVNQGAWVYELRDELTKAFTPKLTWRVGLDGIVRRDKLYFDLPAFPDARLYGPTDPTTIQHTNIPLDIASGALYSDVTWDVGRGLRLIPGIRGDVFHYVGQDRFTVDPRLVARWTMSPVHVWKAGVGIFHQMPEPQLLNPAYGNPNLPPIWADQYSFGFERRLLPPVTLDVTAYFVHRHKQPVPPPPFTAKGEGRSYGLELILKHEFTERFYGWLAYTLSRSEQTAYTVNAAAQGDAGMSGAGTVGQTMPKRWYPTDYDQTHNLIAVGSYKLNAWRFGSRFRLVTGSPTTPIAGSVYDADLDQYQCRYGASNSARKQTFHQLDARIEHVWTFNAWELSTYLDVQNVYNAQNPEATLYDYRCRGSEPIRGLPFLPILGLKGLF